MAAKRKVNRSEYASSVKKTKTSYADPGVKKAKEVEETDYIEDDDEDLMAAAQSGKYDDENEMEWEEQSDEDGSAADSDNDDRSDGEENDDRFDGEGNNEVNSGSKHNKKEEKEAVVAGELEGLKQTAELYKSNLFKLEIDELLKEVSVNYEKQKTPLNALRELKSILESASETKEKPLGKFVKELEKKDSIKVPVSEEQLSSCVNDKFKFAKPSAINVVGGYALKTIIKAKTPYNVDIAVEMPSEVFLSEDYLNHKYFSKRACYLAVLARAIKKANKGFKLEFSSFNGDYRKPILLVKPPADKSEVDFSKSKCVIRIIPCISSDVFESHLLSPSQCNVRSDDNQSTETDKPTPRYNAAILKDTTLTASLAFLYQHSKTCAAFKDAIVLGKVWLYQRGLECTRQSNFGFSSFLFAMIMGYLLQGSFDGRHKKLSAGHSSYQLLRGTIDFLANHDFVKEPVMIGKSEKEEFSEEAFKKNYDITILDPSGTVNLASDLSLSALYQVQHEAKLAMEFFNDSVDRFDALFMKNVNDAKMQFDNYLTVPVPETVIDQYDATARSEYPVYTDFFAKRLFDTLKRGLTNRVKSIAIQYIRDNSWAIDLPASYPQQVQIHVGFILNSDQAPRLVDQGPDPQQKAAAQEFREFWGEKAELRRFKDGSIVESVVWQCQGYEERSLIVRKIVMHLIQRHLDVSPDSVHFWAGQLYPYLHVAKSVPDHLFNRQIHITAFQPVMNAYNEFAKQLRAIGDNLPLMVHNVYPASSSLRYAAVCLPHPVDFDNIIAYPTCARYVEAIDVIIQLERSSKWPDDLEAMQKVKLAFYLKISEELKSTAGIHSVVVDDVREANQLAVRGYLDVYYYGYIFRCRLQVPQEGEILKRIVNDKKETDMKKKERAQQALEKFEHIFHHRQRHTFHIQALCAKYPALSSTMRLVKRWFGVHLLTRHFSEELIELLCAYVFIEPSPWSPAVSAIAGFARVLNLLATWGWRTTPLIVDLGNELKPADRDAILENFSQLRKRNPQMSVGAMVVATPSDLHGLRWSGSKPNKIVLARLQVLAKASINVMQEAIVSGQEKDIKRIFVTPMDDYHAVIQLQTGKCTRYYQNLRPQSKFFSESGLSELGSEIYAEFDPVKELIDEIERIYGEGLMVFHDKYGGDKIALVWDPAMSAPKPWKVTLPYNTVPVDMNDKGLLEPAKGSNEISKVAVPNFEAIKCEIRRLGASLCQ